MFPFKTQKCLLGRHNVDIFVKIGKIEDIYMLCRCTKFGVYWKV